MVPPFIVGVWCGVGKPLCQEYLKPLVAEMKDLMSNGLTVKLKQFVVKFGFVISDSPARSLIKGRFRSICYAYLGEEKI